MFHNLGPDCAIFFIAAMVGRLGFFYLALKNKSQQKASSPDELTFGTPKLAGLVPFVQCGFLGLGLITMVAIWASLPAAPPSHPDPIDPGGIAAAVFLVVIMVALGFGVLWVCPAKNEITLDLSRRTYRYVYGSVLNTKVETGDWSDLLGVYVRSLESGGIKWTSVALSLKPKVEYPPVLGKFDLPTDAEAFAVRTAARLELPVIPAPPRPVPKSEWEPAWRHDW